jgi:hypothetical protein
MTARLRPSKWLSAAFHKFFDQETPLDTGWTVNDVVFWHLLPQQQVLIFELSRLAGPKIWHFQIHL